MSKTEPISQHLENLRGFIVNWDNRFPFDYWWRKKYKVPFNSPQHREACFIDMKIEFEEEKIIKNLFKTIKKEEEESTIYQTTGEYLKKRKLTYKKVSKQEEIDLFDKIDLRELNKNIKK